MQILAHRGWWRSPSEKNSEGAFRAALSAGYGIETDIRDFDGRLVISHDPPRADAMDLDDFLTLYMSYPDRGMLALNVKSDGLASKMVQALAAREIQSYFVFDMSVPDSLHYFKLNATVYTRRSEFEPGSELDQHASGVWLDSFTGRDDPKLMSLAVALPLKSALVSPELHGRDHRMSWESWLATPGLEHAGIALCTDCPDEAHTVFNTASSARKDSSL